MSTLELKIPPVIVAALTGGLMWGAAELLPRLTVLEDWAWMARPFYLAALLLGVGGVIQFALARTTVDPHRVDRASNLVTGGIYRFTRNPMYVAIFLGLIGWFFHLGNIAAMIGLPAFIAYMDRFQIAPEERVLREKFGDEYAGYLKRTRRWL